MNVAIFTDNDFEKVNGVTTTLSAALQWRPPDLKLRVYTAAPLPVDEPDYLALRSWGVPIPFYGEMRMYVPRLLEYMSRARADRIDVVHLTTPGPIGLAGMYVAWRLGLPLVGSFHTDLAAYTERLSGSVRLGELMREYMRWPYGRCARLLVPSHHTRALLIGARTNPMAIEVWPRGVDTATFSPERRSRSLRESWHVSDNRPALIYVGRLSREKGLALLPELSATLLAAGVQHRLVLVGQGPMLDELRRDLPDAIFTGVLNRAAVAEAFASADAMVFPSRTDTAGNVVLEAQASGLPVVVASDGGPRENICEDVTGVVCHTDRAAEWAAAVGRVLRTRSMRAAARDYALTRRWDAALQPLYRAYREVARHVELQDSGPERARTGEPLLRR